MDTNHKSDDELEEELTQFIHTLKRYNWARARALEEMFKIADPVVTFQSYRKIEDGI